MKKLMMTLIALLTMSAAANAMSYEQARNEALFLTDKMAYELNLTDAQYEAAYEINLDYLMGVTSYDDVYGPYWERRNMDFSYILYDWQWNAFCAASYFYRPLYWSAGHWHFGIYARYTVRDFFYFGRPHFYATYRGGHAWHMNGGRSWYYGRGDHFRPAIAHNRDFHGMRSRLDRGVNHSNRGSYGNSRGNNRGSYGNNRGTYGNSRGDYRSDRGYRSGSSTRVTAERNNRSFGSTENRSFGNRPTTTTPNRSETTAPNRSTTTTPNRSSNATPTRSFGGSRSSSSSSSMGSSRSSSSMGSSRSSNMGSSRSSGTTSNSHGHFGGSRR